MKKKKNSKQAPWKSIQEELLESLGTTEVVRKFKIIYWEVKEGAKKKKKHREFFMNIAKLFSK